jgi:hypothetical protein
MLNIFDGEIIRKTLLDFNLAEHYVDAIMTEIERRMQLSDVMQGLQEVIDKDIKGLPDESGPFGQPGPVGIELAGERAQGIEPMWNGGIYQRMPRPQPYNHDRSTL